MRTSVPVLAAPRVRLAVVDGNITKAVRFEWSVASIKQIITPAHMTSLRHDHEQHRARELDYAWRRDHCEPYLDKQNPPKNNYTYHNNMIFYKTHKLYRMLGVEPEAKPERILRQARHVMGNLRRGTEEYNEMRLVVEVLTNPLRKSVYDLWGDDQSEHWLHVPHTAWQNRRDSSYQLPAQKQFVSEKVVKKISKVKERTEADRKKAIERVWDLDKLSSALSAPNPYII